MRIASALLLLLLSASPVLANTFSYIGQNFSYIVNDPLNPQYTTMDHLILSFSVPGTLASNLSFEHQALSLVGISDGTVRLSEFDPSTANVLATGLSNATFLLSTDSASSIVDWSLSLDFANGAYYYSTHNGDQVSTGSHGSFAASHGAGVWTDPPDVAPEPETLVLGVTGFIPALFVLARRRLLT